MKTKEIIDTLRVCADDDIICTACPRYEQYEYGGTAKCYEKLMQEAADALESALREQEERESQKPLSVFLAPMDTYKGLNRKFLVFKLDTGEMVENCFVLRPDKDPAAVAALRAYAEATDNDTLSVDIINWVGAECNDPLTLDELRHMDGEPVWIDDWFEDFHGWELSEDASDYFEGDSRTVESYGTRWEAYRSKPKEEQK